MSEGWNVPHSETIFEASFLKLTREHITTPTRPQGVDWMVVRRPTCAVVAPLTPEGKFVLIRQERVSVRQVTWEFPAGQIDEEVSEASIRATALRELGEETGMECRGELTPLGLFYSSAGFTDEHAHLFLATDVVPRAEGALHGDGEMILEVRAFSKDELRDMIAACEIFDANTLAVYARLTARQML